MIRKAFALGAMLCGALVAGCGGGGGGGVADDTAREITGEQLAQMVLAPDQFGSEYSGFVPDSENGVLSMEQAAQEDDDVDEERSDLQQFGYSSGYRSFHSHADFGGAGIYYIGSVVYLFNTEDGAAGYFTDSIVDDFGEGLDDPELSFRVVGTFDLDVGDQATGARIEGAVQRDDGSSVPLWGSVVYFQHGRLTGALSMFGLQMDEAEKQRIEGNLKARASFMNDRIAGTLAAAAPAAAPEAAARQ